MSAAAFIHPDCGTNPGDSDAFHCAVVCEHAYDSCFPLSDYFVTDVGKTDVVLCECLLQCGDDVTKTLCAVIEAANVTIKLSHESAVRIDYGVLLVQRPLQSLPQDSDKVEVQEGKRPRRRACPARGQSASSSDSTPQRSRGKACARRVGTRWPERKAARTAFPPLLCPLILPSAR